MFSYHIKRALASLQGQIKQWLFFTSFLTSFPCTSIYSTGNVPLCSVIKWWDSWREAMGKFMKSHPGFCAVGMIWLPVFLPSEMQAVHSDCAPAGAVVLFNKHWFPGHRAWLTRPSFKASEGLVGWSHAHLLHASFFLITCPWGEKKSERISFSVLPDDWFLSHRQVQLTSSWIIAWIAWSAVLGQILSWQKNYM